MNAQKNPEIILVKNVIDYGDLNEKNISSNLLKSFPNYRSSKSCLENDSSSLDEKIIDILNFKDENDSVGSFVNENNDDLADALDDGFDEELEFICSLGLETSESPWASTGIDRDSLENYFNPYFESHPDELAMLSFYDDFVLLELGLDDMIKEVYFEE